MKPLSLGRARKSLMGHYRSGMELSESFERLCRDYPDKVSVYSAMTVYRRVYADNAVMWALPEAKAQARAALEMARTCRLSARTCPVGPLWTELRVQAATWLYIACELTRAYAYGPTWESAER